MIQISVSGETIAELRERLVALAMSLPLPTLEPSKQEEVQMNKNTNAPAVTPEEPAAPPPPAPSPAEDSAPVVAKFDDVRAALRSKFSALIGAGKQTQVNELVKRYAPTLSRVADADLAELTVAAEAL